MTRLKEKLKRVDAFMVLLAGFLITLLALIYYLIRSDLKVRNFTDYFVKIQSLNTLQHRIDRVMDKPFRFVPYDTLNQDIERFETTLRELKHSALSDEFGVEFGTMLDVLARDFRRATLYIEDFKTYNARLTATVHNLYELLQAMEIQHRRSRKVDDIFFEITRILMDMPVDEKEIRKKLASLKTTLRADKIHTMFVSYTYEFLRNTSKMKRVIRAYDELHLSDTIEQIRSQLSTKYLMHTETQRNIAVLLFLLGVAIVFILIGNYKRLRRTTHELRAFKSAIENSDNAIVMTDTNRRIEYVNDAFEKLSGYKKEEAIGKRSGFMKSGLTPQKVYKELNKTLSQGKKWQGELINRRKDGSLIYEKVSIVPVHIDGELRKFLAVKLDVTAYKKQLMELTRAAAVYEALTDGVTIADVTKRIISVNPAVREIFGYARQELIGKSIDAIALYYQNGTRMSIPWEVLHKAGKWSAKVYKKTKSGKTVPVWLTMIVVRNQKGEIENYIAIDTDLKDIFKMQKRIERYAFYDRLTKLPNRIFFESNSKSFLKAAEKNRKKAALLFADLDRFKVINDTLGHDVGDKLLKKVAMRFQRVLGDDVFLARMGGDEFIALVAFDGDGEEVKQKAEAMLRALREPIEVDGYLLSTTVSIGISVYPDDTRITSELVRFADAAMYDAKEHGKNNYKFYTQRLSEHVAQRLHIEQELRYALEKNEFYLVFQPQCNLQTEHFEAVEALLRWENEKLGTVPPDAFISIAEETGMIVEIGAWVANEVCRIYAERFSKIPTLRRISFNVSTVQFEHGHIYHTLKESINQYGIDASVLELEITERLILEYSTFNLQTLRSLREMGCHIALDDFGTGYSSLHYMKKMAIDTIKIDRSFVDELPDNPHDAEVTKAIIALSKSLGYHVVAEGIETREQERFLKEHGCDMGQGYLYAKPMKEDEIVAFLKDGDKC